MAQANRAGYQSAIQSVSSFMDYIPIFGESKLLLEGAFGKDLFTDRQLGGTERVLDIFLGAAGLGMYAAEAKAEGRAVTEGVENSRVGMCGLHSFSADTPVATDANGDTKPISELKVGEYVLGYDQETGASGTYTVTAVMVHTDPTIVDLTIDGDTVETTPTHFFYTQEYGWVQAGALWQGAHVRKADGSYGMVEATKTVERSQQMYDLTVEGAHTFFVGDKQFLVHNTECLPSGQGKDISGVAPQEYAPSVPTSAGRNARKLGGEGALQSLYGPGQPLTFVTQYGERDVDLVVESGNRVYAHESKNFARPVPAGTHQLQEALKDWELMQTKPGYTPIWHFWDAGPTPNLAATLKEFGISYIKYNQ